MYIKINRGKIVVTLSLIITLFMVGCDRTEEILKNDSLESSEISEWNTEDLHVSETESVTSEADVWDITNGLPADIRFNDIFALAESDCSMKWYDEQGKELGSVSAGTKVKVVGRGNVKNVEVLKIQIEENVGYVVNSNIFLKEFEFSTDNVNDEVYQTINKTGIWEVPDLSAKLLCEVSAKETLEIVSVSVDNQWYKVSYLEYEGYIPAKFISVKPAISASLTDVTLEDDSQEVIIKVRGPEAWTVTYTTHNKKIVECQWGTRIGDEIALKLTPKNGGCTTVTISLDGTEESVVLNVKVNKKTEEEIWLEEIEEEYTAMGYVSYHVESMEEAMELAPKLIGYGKYIFFGDKEVVSYMWGELYDAARYRTYLFEEGCIYGHIEFATKGSISADAFHILKSERYPEQYEAYKEQGYTIYKVLTMQQAEEIKSQITPGKRYVFYCYDDEIIRMLDEYLREEQRKVVEIFEKEFLGGNKDASYWSYRLLIDDVDAPFYWYTLEFEDVYLN